MLDTSSSSAISVQIYINRTLPIHIFVKSNFVWIIN